MSKVGFDVLIGNETILFKVQSSHIFASMAEQTNKISVEEYASKYNPVLNRRNKRMSASYIYRLIREDIKGEPSRDIWFNYELTGEKDRIYIVLNT